MIILFVDFCHVGLIPLNCFTLELKA